MALEMLSLALSVVSAIPLSTKAPAAAPLNAVYAEWKTSATIQYPCWDPNNTIDPAGEVVVVSKTMKDQAGGDYTITKPVIIYPETKICKKDVWQNHTQLFASENEADRFRADCSEGCREWSERVATEDEVCSYILKKNQWTVHHLPGGDPLYYPHGFYEIWPKNETVFDPETRLGVGPTQYKAIMEATGGAL